MDKRQLSIRASEVAEVLKAFMADLAGQVADDQSDQDLKVAEQLRAGATGLDERQSNRDGEVLKSVADQVKALREDVRRLNREREEATQDIVKVATAGLRS